MERISWEFKDKIRRQSPGSDKCTEFIAKKLKEISEKEKVTNKVASEKIKILNIACGCGYETLVLAKNFNADIIALDASETYLNKLIKMKELEDELKNIEITTMTENMEDIPLKSNSCDLIWCEGSINILGFKRALKLWKRLLKKDGYMVVSDYTLKTNHSYNESEDIIRTFYPEIKNLNENKALAKKLGYELVDTFTLGDDAWINEFITPILDAVNEMERKFSRKKAYLDYLDEIINSVDTIMQYREEIDFVFYIFKVK